MSDGGIPISPPSQANEIVSPIIQEAFELLNLQINNSTLLDYGLHTGLIERLTNGQMIMSLLNIKLMTGGEMFKSVLIEFLIRLGIFISASSFVKTAIESNVQNQDADDGILGLYVFSILIHQITNFDTVSLRTINRLLMTMAILLFSITTPNSAPCESMRNFKKRMKRRLIVDYYLWCLLFAMDLILTCSSPLHINLEQEYGIEFNIAHLILTVYCVLHLSKSMQMIGHGRLTPLILGTPLLFLDAGDSISSAKGTLLFMYYARFWLSDWRELVDWNHVMLCEAGVCSVLCNGRGDLSHIRREAKTKFHDWLLEHGLDDNGWFILLDPPANMTNGSIVTDSGTQPDTDENEDEDARPATSEILIERDYTGRAIYLRSRNPLLTSLAAVIIIMLK